LIFCFEWGENRHDLNAPRFRAINCKHRDG
jgi:hypothetical protein